VFYESRMVLVELAIFGDAPSVEAGKWQQQLPQGVLILRSKIKVNPELFTYAQCISLPPHYCYCFFPLPYVLQGKWPILSYIARLALIAWKTEHLQVSQAVQLSGKSLFSF
jgi:hypothetical protein